MLGRRLFGPRDLVLPYDPAVDEKGSDLTKYAETLEREHLAIREGAQPTVFRVTPLTEAQKRALRQHETGSFEFAERAFLCGILEISSYPVQRSDGVSGDPPHPDRKQRSPWGECASKEWLDSACIAHTDIEIVGAMIWRLSEARPLS